MSQKKIAILVQEGMEDYDIIEGVEEAVAEENALMALRGENAGFFTQVFNVVRGAGEVSKAVTAAVDSGAKFVVSTLTPEFGAEADRALRNSLIAGANLLGTGNTDGALEYHKSRVAAVRARLEEKINKMKENKQTESLNNFSFCSNGENNLSNMNTSFLNLSGSQQKSEEQQKKTLSRREIKDLKRKGLYKEPSALALEENMNPLIIPTNSSFISFMKEDNVKLEPLQKIDGENSVTLLGIAAVGVPLLLGAAGVAASLAPHVGKMVKGFVDGMNGYGCGPKSAEAEASFKAAGVKDVVYEKTPLIMMNENGEKMYRKLETRVEEIYEAVKTRLASITQGSFIFFSVVPTQDVEKYIDAIYELSRYNNMQFNVIFQTLNSIVQKAMEKYPNARFAACGIEYNTPIKDISYDLGNVAIRAIKTPQVRPDNFPGRSGWMNSKTQKTIVTMASANGKELIKEVIETPLGDRSFFSGFQIPFPYPTFAPSSLSVKCICDKYTGFSITRPENVISLNSDLLQSISESNDKTINSIDTKISELNKKLEEKTLEQITKLSNKIIFLKKQNEELKNKSQKNQTSLHNIL